MGKSHSKSKKPNNPMEEEEMRRRKQLKRVKEEQERQKAIEKKLKKGKLIPLKSRPEQAPAPASGIPREITKEEYERLATKELQKQLISNFSSFVLNQMLLSIQFFGNFEREKLSASERCFKLENERNQTLEKHSIILPNILDEAVEKRIRYQAKHGVDKNQPINLHVQNVYVIYENVEICKANDANYDVISPTFKLHIDQENVEKLKMWKGYVRLKLSEKSKTTNRKLVNIFHSRDQNYSKSSDLERHRITAKRQRQQLQRKKRNSCSSSSYSDDECTYGHGDDDGDCYFCYSDGANINNNNSNSNNQKVIKCELGKTFAPSSSTSGIYESLNSYGGSNSAGGVYSGIGSRSTSSSLTNFSFSDYDYAYISNLNTHQPFNQLTENLDSSQSNFTASKLNSVIPDYCITEVKIPLNNNNNRLPEVVESGSDSDFESEPDVLQVKYLNSKYFFRYFASALKEKLAVNLGLNKSDLENATWKGATIYTPKYEIIPALHLAVWPDCAFEWQRRARKIHINPINGQNLQWPTQEMIKRIVSFGCHIIPFGYVSKNEKNPTRELEWKIVFPKAVRHLESCLSSTQVKVFMIVKTLMKTFIEPRQKKDVNMFSLDHLRTHLFWLCEDNYGAWPEEFLGETLVRYLTTFLDRLSTKKLPDYFIMGRNLFESIPESCLAKLHMTISQIVQNPVMHLMAAYRNIDYLEEFYPKLNYKKLYASIVIDNPLELYSKMRISKRNTGKDVFNETYSNLRSSKRGRNANNQKHESDSDEDRQEGLIGYSNKKERFDESRRRGTKRLKKKEKIRLQKRLQAQIEKRGSINSIDLEFVIPKDLSKIPRSSTEIVEIRRKLDNIRRMLIIEIFIRNFISMAKDSYRFKSFNQAKIYLNQANRLCILIYEDYGDENLAKRFSDTIQQIRSAVEMAQISENLVAPALPIRISLDPIRTGRNCELKTNFNSSSIPFSNLRNENEQNNQLLPSSSSPFSLWEHRKSVQFREIQQAQFIEPRTFSVEAEIHANNKKSRKMKSTGNSLKQQSSVESTSSNSSVECINFYNRKLNVIKPDSLILTSHYDSSGESDDDDDDEVIKPRAKRTGS